MNLRCTYCQTPFTVGRLEKLAAIQRMQAESLHHFDVFCPRCRRANSVSRQRLEMFTPGWQEGLKTLEAEAAKIEKERMEPAPAPLETKPAPAPVEATRNRHASKLTVTAPILADSKPVATSSPKGKPVAKPAPKATPSPKGKPVAKPAAKATSAPKAKPAAKPAATPSPKGKPAAPKTTGKAKPAAKAKKPAAKKK